MGAQPSGKFPDALDRVEFRAVSGQEFQLELLAVAAQKGFQQLGMVILGVVKNPYKSTVAESMR